MTPHTQPPTRARVLVVEDSSVFRELQALLLRQAGYGVCTFETPAAALAEIAHQSFDVAVVDYELPGMNGAEFMLALRELRPGIPVIFVSGSLSLELVSDLTRQGASGIFRKPVNPRVLLEKIHETLNRSAREPELRARADLANGVSAAPFAAPAPAADRLAYEPQFFLGQSAAFRAFTHELWRVRDFRSALALHGNPGSPFEPVARELIRLSVFRGGPTMVCRADEFTSDKLAEILAPSLLAATAGTLIVLGVDDFSAEQQSLLHDLVMLRGMFQPFVRCIRVILVTTDRLVARVEAGNFDETLFSKITALQLAIPTLASLPGDIALNAAHLLERHSSSVDASAPLALGPDAAHWLELQTWPGDHAQLERLLLFALRYASGRQLSRAALEAAAHDYALHREAEANAAAIASLRPGPTLEFAADVPAGVVRVHPAHAPARVASTP